MFEKDKDNLLIKYFKIDLDKTTDLFFSPLFLFYSSALANFLVKPFPRLPSHRHHITLPTSYSSARMPEAADLVAAADTLEQASMYAEAITAYTRAIELVPTAPQYYIKRCLRST